MLAFLGRDPNHSQKWYRLVASCQFYQLVATCQQVAKTLSILSSCNKPVKTKLVEASCNTPVEIMGLQQVGWQPAPDLLSQAVVSHANAS